jgi:hypothetical protein
VHINKALKTRCKAIKAALHKYNEIAKSMDRPELDWKELTTYDSLAEFDLLKECRLDIRQQSWAEAKTRQATIHFLRLERANEERVRLNIEISRLVDWMASEEQQLSSAVQRLRADGCSLAMEVNEILARRLRQNTVHRIRIQKIYQLSCYTGVRDIRITHQDSGSGGVGIDLEERGSDTAQPNDAEEDDTAGDELDRLNEFLSDLSLADM